MSNNGYIRWFESLSKADVPLVGICGQAPSDYPAFAAFLVERGIDSLSLNPDSIISVIRRVAETERRLDREQAIMVV